MTHLGTSVHHDIDIFIFSDSQAALRTLDSYTTNSKTISECRKSPNEMGSSENQPQLGAWTLKY